MSNTVPPGGLSFNDDNRQYRIKGNVLLTALVCLAFVVVLVVFLHLYARYVLRRQQTRRRAAINHMIGITSNQAQTHEQPKVGLDPSVIAALPRFEYKTPDGSVEAAAPECAVCLSTVEEGGMVRVLPNCKHTFHVECIDMWLHSHSTCPICRAEAEPQQNVVVIDVEPRAVQPAAVGASNCSGASSACSKEGSSTSRLGSFRRMMSWERSERRPQADGVDDLVRQ